MSKDMIPTAMFQPTEISAPNGAVVLSDTHCADPARNPGYGERLAAFITKMSRQSVLILNGDVGRDSDPIAFYGPSAVEWSPNTILLWQIIAAFIREGGKVWLIPATHNRPLEQWYAKQGGGFQQLHNYPNYLDDLPPHLTPSEQKLIGEVRLAPSMLVKVGSTRVLIDHGNTFDWALPIVHWVFKWLKPLLPKPAVGQNFGKAVQGGIVALKLTRSHIKYAALAEKYGCTAALIGHWHCPNWQWRNANGTLVMVASLCTDGACKVTEITVARGQITQFDLLNPAKYRNTFIG